MYYVTFIRYYLGHILYTSFDCVISYY